MSERRFGGSQTILSYVESISGKVPSSQADARSLPTILVLHGLFGMSDNWASVVADLCRVFGDAGKTRRFVTIDMPGHAYSMSPPTMSYDEIGAAVREFIEEEVSGPLTVVGHSLGGKTALTLLVDTVVPDLQAACISDIVPKFYPDGHSHIIKALRSARHASDRREAEARLSEHLNDWGLRAYLLKSFVAGNGGANNAGANNSGTGNAIANTGPGSADLPRWLDHRLPWLFDLDAIENDYRYIQGWDLEVPRTNLPVLWVAGAKSTYIDPEGDAELMRTVSPNSRLAVIEGAGHWVHAEKRREFVEAFTSWYFEVAGGEP